MGAAGVHRAGEETARLPGMVTTPGPGSSCPADQPHACRSRGCSLGLYPSPSLPAAPATNAIALPASLAPRPFVRVRKAVSFVIPKDAIPLLAFCLPQLAASPFSQVRSLAPSKLGDRQVAQTSAP